MHVYMSTPLRAEVQQCVAVGLATCLVVDAATCQHSHMQIASVISQKGGSGKTTLTLNLAIAASHDRKQVAVIDLDPQQSSSRWARLRADDNPVFISGHASNLASLLERARGAGADVVFIDTAPSSEGAALTAARAADLVIIPCRPSNLDLDAVGDTVNIAKLANKPAMFVLNGCQAGSSLAEEAAEALTEYGLPILPVRIGQRVAFVKSLTKGLGVIEADPSSPAASEIRQLYKHTFKKGGM